MIREDIFSIDFPKDDKFRSFFNVKRLNEQFVSVRLFDRTAATIAAKFPVNAKINQKIKSDPSYLETWQKLCTLLFSYLIGPSKFLDRNDADDLVCLPIVTKIAINNSLQTVRAISIYNSTKRIGTLFFRDPEFNNEFSFYGQNGFVSIGSWASKVRSDVQGYNLYGLTKAASTKPAAQTIAKSLIIESTEAVGNTITVHDIFSKIEKMKQQFTGTH